MFLLQVSAIPTIKGAIQMQCSVVWLLFSGASLILHTGLEECRPLEAIFYVLLWNCLNIMNRAVVWDIQQSNAMKLWQLETIFIVLKCKLLV